MSLKRIADFGQAETHDPLVSAAIHALVYFGGGWPTSHLTGFFEDVQLMHQLISDVQSRLLEEAQSRLNVQNGLEERDPAGFPSPKLFRMPPERWVIGKRLPEIYERIFNEKFSINTWEDVDHRVPGNEFILGALAVMDIWPNGKRGDSWSLQTIKSHCRLARPSGEQPQNFCVPSP